MGREGTSRRLMKSKIAQSILCLLLIFGMACSKRIEPGHSGILENSDSPILSVDEVVLLKGKIYYNPFTESIHTFSHAMHRVKWDFDDDDAANSKEIAFSSFGGATVESAMEIGYTYKPGRIPHVFVTLRNTSGMAVEDYMWQSTREAINECAETLPVEAIYGPQKTNITNCALEKLRQKSFVRDNFDLSYLNFVGRFRFNTAIWDAINYEISTRIGTEVSERENAARRRSEILDAKTGKEVLRIEAEGIDRLNESLTDSVLIYLEKPRPSEDKLPVEPAAPWPWAPEPSQCVK